MGQSSVVRIMASTRETASSSASGNGDEPQIDGASILARALKEQVKYHFCMLVLFRVYLSLHGHAERK